MGFIHDLEQKLFDFVIDHTVAEPLAESMVDALITPVRPFASFARTYSKVCKIEDNLGRLERLQEKQRRKEVNNAVSNLDAARDSLSRIIYKN